MKIVKRMLLLLGAFLLTTLQVFASEADLAIPDLHAGRFSAFGGISAWDCFLRRMRHCGHTGIQLVFTVSNKEASCPRIDA